MGGGGGAARLSLSLSANWPAPSAVPAARPFASSCRLVDYDHTVCQYEGIQDAYDPACKFIFLRATAALFGTLTGTFAWRWLCG